MSFVGECWNVDSFFFCLVLIGGCVVCSMVLLLLHWMEEEVKVFEIALFVFFCQFESIEIEIDRLDLDYVLRLSLILIF